MLAGAAVLVAVTVTGGVVVASGADQATPAAPEAPANTVKVQKGELSSMVSLRRDPDLPGAIGRLAVLRDQPGPRDLHQAAR